MTSEKKTARRVSPRHWALAGTVAASALAASHPVTAPFSPITPAMAQENGEAGEAGVVLSDGPSAFLTELGLFEAAHRITAALYAKGETGLAQEHLDLSHHAFYDDLAPKVVDHGAPGFEAETRAFAEAVNGGDAPAAVAAAEAAVLAAIETARTAAGASARDQILSVKDLISVAAADYAGGVEEGAVSFAQEYRDAWGFVEVARARATSLSASPDPAVAKAGQDVLEQLAALTPLFPGLTAETAGGDPTLIPAAAAWIEIIALRLK